MPLPVLKKREIPEKEKLLRVPKVPPPPAAYREWYEDYKDARAAYKKDLAAYEKQLEEYEAAKAASEPHPPAYARPEIPSQAPATKSPFEHVKPEIPAQSPFPYARPEIPAQEPEYVEPFKGAIEPPKEIFFTGPQFEEVFGQKLPMGWDASYIWDETDTAPTITVYAPGGVKLSLEDIGISPTGEWVYGEREPAMPGEDRFALPEGALPVEERLEYFRYQAQIRLEDILSEVFDEGVEEALTLAGEDPDAFIDAVAAIGRNDATEDLLLEMGLTEDELDMVFGPVLPELPTSEPDAVFFPLVGQIKQLSAEQKEAAPTWVKSFASGVGDVYSAVAGAARWLGYDDIGAGLSKEAERMHREYFYPDTIGDFEFADLLNPDFYAEKIVRTIPFALSLAPLAVGGYFAGAGIATAAGLGTVWSAIVGGFAGAALSRPMESAMEAGTQYDDAIARGKTEKEAKEEADEVFRNNMTLAGMDAFQIAIALAPTPKWIPSALIKGGLVRTARIGGKMVIVGLSEGGEEVYQDLISRRAKGEEWKWDPISKEVFAIGMVMGLGMGLGGDVISPIVNRSKESMPADMKKDFDGFVKDFLKEGFPLDQAELRALDSIAQTPEGQSLVAKVIEQAKAFIKEERGAIGRPAEVLKRLATPELTQQYITLKEQGKKVGLDAEAIQAIKEGEYWVSITTTSLGGTESFNDWIQSLQEKGVETEKVKGLLVGKFEEKEAERGREDIGFGRKRFLPFKSLADAQQFIDTGDTTFIASGLELKGSPWTAEQLTQAQVGLAQMRPFKLGEVAIPTPTAPRIELRPMEAKPGEGFEIVVNDNVVGELDFRSTEGLGIVGNMLVDMEVFPEMKRKGIATQALDEVMLRSEEQKRPLYSGLLKPEGELWLKGLEKRGVIKLEKQDQKLLGYLISRPEPTAKVKPPVAEEVKISPEREVFREGGVPVSPDEPIPQGVVKNIPIIKDIGVKERWFRPSRKVFERMGMYETYKGIQRAEVELGEANAAFAKKLKAVAKTVDKSRRHFIFRELENPGSQVGLRWEEKRAVTFFKENFNKWADALNLPQEKRIKNYITHIFEADITEQLKEKHPLDPAIARALDDRAPKTIFNPFLQERLGATIGLIEDPFAAALAYESRQLRVFYYEPFLQKIEVIANDPNTPQVMGDYLKDYSRRMTKQPSKLDKSINNTLQEFAGAIEKLPGGKPFASFLSRGNPSGLAAYQFTGVIYTLWLGFKPTSAIRNLSQHTLIIGEVGPISFADGMRLRVTEEGRDAVNNHSLTWRSRKAAFVPGIDDSFVDKWTDKFRETALWMFRKADEQNVKDAFLAGYSEAKRLLPDADKQVWYDRGDEVAADTQYLYTQMNSMAISQSSAGRVFAILTTWSQNWVELMAKWVARRPSQVYKQYEKETGKKVAVANWSTSYKAILMYMAIVGLGYALKEEKRLKAWEYTGITSIRYLADVVGGDFPGLQGPGAIANMIAGFLTDDERMFKQGWYDFKSTFTPGIVRQLTAVANGDKDWLTLFFYLEGRDFYIKKLKDKWEKGWKEYEGLESKDRTQYRKDNPLIEAQMFITSKFSTLSTEEARREVLRLIEANDLDVELIDGYDKVFGVDTDEKFTEYKKLLGTVELDEEGNQKLKENGELDYYTTSNFATDVNKLVKTVGRYKVEQDGNALAIAYLRAKDLFVQYDSLTDSAARLAYRQQFPDVEAQLYLWGKISTFKNPGSAGILLGLLEEYGIPPESVPAFLDNPEKYDALFTEKFELEQKWFGLRTEYDNLGEPESDTYIENDEERAEARAKLKEDNPGWMADIRRLEAFDFDASPAVVESWVKRGEVVDEFGAGSPEAKLWLIENPDLHKWALDQNLLTDDGTDWNESILRLDVEMRGLDEGSDKYRRLDYKKDALQRGFPEGQTDTYVDWYMTKRSGYEDDWFLMENKEFYQTMVNEGILQERDFSKIPTREQAKESDTFQGLSSSGYVRDRYLQDNKDFYKDVWLGLWGNKKIDFSKVPSEEVESLYEEYFTVGEGAARLVFRHNNPEFEKWLVHAKGYTPVGDRWQAYPTGDEGEPLTELEAILKELEEARRKLQ